MRQVLRSCWARTCIPYAALGDRPVNCPSSMLDRLHYDAAGKPNPMGSNLLPRSQHQAMAWIPGLGEDYSDHLALAFQVSKALESP